MSRGLPFEFQVPISMWMDKSAPEGRQKRFGGLISTESKDRQKEVVLQKGLDLAPFKQNGWYNDNHTKDTDGIVGFPDPNSIKYVKKGEVLPDGRKAPADGHWSEGYMLDNERGLKLWDTAQALKKAGDERRLGFSIEGGIHKRIGHDNKIIAKATVKNVAITNCPVNLDTRMETLIKSLEAVESAETPDDLWKMLGMGTSAGPLPKPAGPLSGEQAGQVLAVQSLETDARLTEEQKKEFAKLKKKEEAEEKKKSLTEEEAFTLVKARFPNVSRSLVGRVLDVAHLVKGR